jgi:hypothetical protein
MSEADTAARIKQQPECLHEETVWVAVEEFQSGVEAKPGKLKSEQVDGFELNSADELLCRLASCGQKK